MNKIILFASIILILFGIYNSANALPNSGEYMFTLKGNDSNTPEAEVEAAINGWFVKKGIAHDPVDLSFYVKADAPATFSESLTMSYEDDKKAGIWTTAEAIEFYTVKAGKQFAFYWVEGGSASGTWNTEHLTNKKGINRQISHFSAWNPVGVTSASVEPVPEPGTILLLGAGMLGIGCIARRKIRT